MTDKISIIEGILQDESVTYTLVEISERYVIDITLLHEMLAYSIIEPKGLSPHMIFDAVAVHRCRQALRLKQDLHINWEGIGVVLDLLEEIDDLHRQLEKR